MTSQHSTSENIGKSSTRHYWRRRDGARGGWWPGGLIPALGLIATFLYGVVATAPAMESQTAERVSGELTRQGLEDFVVNVDGQEVLIRAAAANADRDRVLAWAQNTQCETWIAGERVCPNTVRVELTGDPAPAQQPATAPSAVVATSAHDFVFLEQGDTLRLSGNVPSNGARQQIVAAARRIHQNVIADLTVTGNTATDGFDWAIDKSWPLIGLLDEARIQWSDGRFSASGRALALQAEAARGAFGNAAFTNRLGSLDIDPLVTAASCNENFAAALSDATIEFQTSSAEISSSSRGLIEELATLARSCPMQITIAGHTDNVGSAAFNDPLSLARAESVVSAFADLGVDTGRLTARGFGASQPIADNASPTGRARNRRIEITVTE